MNASNTTFDHATPRRQQQQQQQYRQGQLNAFTTSAHWVRSLSRSHVRTEMTVTSYTFAILKLRSSWTKVYQIFTRCGQIIVDYVFNSEWRCFKPFRNAKATNKFTAKSVSERILKINQHLTKKHKYSGTFFQTRCTVDHPSISESLSLADLGCKVGTGQIGLRRRRRRRKGGWEWEPGVLASWRHGPLPPPKSASGHCNTGSMRITRAYYRRIILILCTKSTLI